MVENKFKGYREHDDSEFTHHGVRYNINKLLSLIEKDGNEIYKFKTRKLVWILDYDTADPERVMKADITTPLIISREKGIYYTIDGLHRLSKAVQQKEKELSGYLVTEKQLLLSRS